MSVHENAADAAQRDKLERERRLSKKSRGCDIFITALFCLLIGGFAMLHIVMPDLEYSERENRMLQQFPEFSAGALFSGTYSSDMTEYLSDQFPFRDFFVVVKASSERMLGRMENGGVMFCKDNLTARKDSPDTENLKINMDAASTFSAALENSGIPTILAVAGRRADVCIDTLPPLYGDVCQNRLWDAIDLYGDEFSGAYLNLRIPLRERAAAGEEVYYRTDHHWTSLGAYYAYAELWEVLPESLTSGMEIRALDFFTREIVTKDFYGTAYSASGAAWVKPDAIELFRYDGDDAVLVKNVDTGETVTGMYRLEYLEVRDKYSVFLGENAGRLDIEGAGNDRKTIVVIKDSFAQSAAPFLAADFNVVMIDPRYFSASVYRTVADISPDAVVILMNADTLTSSAVLRPLLRGVE